MTSNLPQIPKRSNSLPNAKRVRFIPESQEQQFDSLLQELVTTTVPKAPQTTRFKRTKVYQLPEFIIHQNFDFPDSEVVPAQVSPKRKFNLARLQRLQNQQNELK